MSSTFSSSFAESRDLAPGVSLSRRRRYAIVGVGSRHELYHDAIQKTYAAQAELVALCDSNAGRLERARGRSALNGVPAPAGFSASDFDRLVAEAKPDIVIVTAPDAVHDEYIVRALEAGCDVITEKPMATDAGKCRRIVEATRRTGRKCRVTFNYRYSPPRSQVKELLMDGTIGDVLSVDFHWLLNTHHGADYFRRWHSHKRMSGGLFVHKATHHFDLVNWWLGATPVSVMAMGKREFYTPETAKRMGLSGAHERCLTCREKDQCGFFLDLAAAPNLKSLYLDCESHDGYFRDRCVWRPDIDIEDTMTALVDYDTGATLSYSLNAFNAWEGYTIAFNGTKGRLEHTIVESSYSGGRNHGVANVPVNQVTTRIIPLRGAACEITPWVAGGDHGGGDRLLLDDLFAPGTSPDPFGRAADEEAGAWSILTGIAANRSLETGGRVQLADLMPGLAKPGYPSMPSRRDRIPMPPRGG